MPDSDAKALVRAAIAALNERDADAYLACCADDVELVPAAAAMEGAFRGADGIRRFLAELDEVSEDLRLREQALAEPVAGRVVVASVRGTATGRASGVPAEFEATTVYDLRDGRISRVRVFLDRNEALEATRAAVAAAAE